MGLTTTAAVAGAVRRSASASVSRAFCFFPPRGRSAASSLHRKSPAAGAIDQVRLVRLFCENDHFENYTAGDTRRLVDRDARQRRQPPSATGAMTNKRPMSCPNPNRMQVE